MATLARKDIGTECDFVAEGSSPRKVKNTMFEHVRDEHPELIAGITGERRRELELAMDEAIAHRLMV
jgi:predicted small metal-binding protein